MLVGWLGADILNGSAGRDTFYGGQIDRAAGDVVESPSREDTRWGGSRCPPMSISPHSKRK